MKMRCTYCGKNSGNSDICHDCKKAMGASGRDIFAGAALGAIGGGLAGGAAGAGAGAVAGAALGFGISLGTPRKKRKSH